MANLYELLQGYCEPGVYNDLNQDFLPADCLSRLITSETIEQEFRELEGAPTEYDPRDENHQQLLTFILGNAKKVFATTAYCDTYGNALFRTMSSFKECKIQDSSLPIELETLSAGLSRFYPRPWSASKKKSFYENQFIFLAPIFSRSVFKHELHQRDIFPFIKKVGRNPKEGTFSHVYQFIIHNSHQTITMGDAGLHVAIKEFKKDLNTDWEKEANALEAIRTLDHDHIIQRFATITQGDKRYLMFQWADGGTLTDYWTENPQPRFTPSIVKQVVAQLRGLADALDALHGFGTGSYRDGDLKPDNILRFTDQPDIGTLKIADMGLSKHHTEATYLRPPTSTRYGTVRYEPPEAVHQLPEAMEFGRSRLYDIWSIGCITLELIVWLLYGYEELTKFNESLKDSLPDSSPYWEHTDGSSCVHSKVVSCMDDIAKDIECVGNTAIGDLLKLVRTKLLVADLPPRLRNPALDRLGANVPIIKTDEIKSPTGPFRATAVEFRDELDKIISRGAVNTLYWATGKARAGIKGPCSSRIYLPKPGTLLSPESANQKKPLMAGLNVGETAKKKLSYRPNLVRTNSNTSR